MLYCAVDGEPDEAGLCSVAQHTRLICSVASQVWTWCGKSGKCSFVQWHHFSSRS